MLAARPSCLSLSVNSTWSGSSSRHFPLRDSISGFNEWLPRPLYLSTTGNVDSSSHTRKGMWRKAGPVKTPCRVQRVNPLNLRTQVSVLFPGATPSPLARAQLCAWCREFKMVVGPQAAPGQPAFSSLQAGIEAVLFPAHSWFPVGLECVPQQTSSCWRGLG